jgi:hypothetical protein
MGLPLTMGGASEDRAPSTDARSWMFERLHADPVEAHRALACADPGAGAAVVARSMAPVGAIAVPGLHGISLHRAVAHGVQCIVLLVEWRRGADATRLRGATAALVRGIRRAHGGSIRVFVAFVPK